MKKILIKEFSPIYLCLAAVILFVLLSGFGVVHIVVKSIYKRNLKGFLSYWIKLIYQIWNVIKYWLLQLALTLDLAGNVTCGEAIEDCITTEENTLFGKGDIMISVATGELEYKGKLMERGVKFSNILSKILGKNHCVVAYKQYLKDL